MNGINNVAQIVSAKRNVEDSLMNLPGVTGVDVGYKYVNGQKTDEISIRVLVEKKRAKVPEAQMVPPMIDGIRTDVLERRYVLQPLSVRVEDIAIMADTGHYDPLKGGISIGPCRSVGGFVFAGTLGAIVKDNDTGNPMLLSNFHVMCVDNGWHVGDTMAQPSLIDTGTCPADVVGSLQRAVLDQSVDCAVASKTARGTVCEIADIGSVTGTEVASLGMAVRKRGRTTGLTYGTVDSIDLTVTVDYGDGIGSRTLKNQIGLQVDPAHSTKIGDHGDSGSVVVNNARKVVGLYFAGSDDGKSGVANPIAAVLNALNVSLCVPSKSIVKDLKDGKREKIEIKEGKREKVEIKERKEKIEIKERKELKEFKPEKLEFEKIQPEKNPKELIENPKLLEGGDPFNPSQPPMHPGPGDPIEQRIARVEDAINLLSHFISSELRPDLGAGALAGETDMDTTSLSQQLAKEASDAKQAKDNKDVEKLRER